MSKCIVVGRGLPDQSMMLQIAHQDANPHKEASADGEAPARQGPRLLRAHGA